MSNNLSYEFISRLEALQNGQLAILRNLRYHSLDFNLEGFDMFTALWWSLREKGKNAPRREIAWMITKLYAGSVLHHEKGAELPKLLGHQFRSAHNDDATSDMIRNNVALLINSTISTIEPALSSCLSLVKKEYSSLDWVDLLDTISVWEVPSVRKRWAQEFFYNARIINK